MNKKQILFTLLGLLSLSALTNTAAREDSKRKCVTPPARLEAKPRFVPRGVRSASVSPKTTAAYLYGDIDRVLHLLEKLDLVPRTPSPRSGGTSPLHKLVVLRQFTLRNPDGLPIRELLALEAAAKAAE